MNLGSHGRGLGSHHRRSDGPRRIQEESVVGRGLHAGGLLRGVAFVNVAIWRLGIDNGGAYTSYDILLVSMLRGTHFPLGPGRPQQLCMGDASRLTHSTLRLAHTTSSLSDTAHPENGSGRRVEAQRRLHICEQLRIIHRKGTWFVAASQSGAGEANLRYIARYSRSPLRCLLKSLPICQISLPWLLGHTE